MAPYPVSLLKEAGELQLETGGMLSFFTSLLTSSVIASGSRAAKVYGTQIVKDGTLSDYVQKTISLVGGAFIVAKAGAGSMDSSIAESGLGSVGSMMESSLNSLETASSLESLRLPEVLAAKATSAEGVEAQAAALGFSGTA